MNRLPMSFDWHTAKQNTASPFAAQPQQLFGQHSPQYAPDIVQSLVKHINDNIKHTTDTEGYAACGKDAYRYVTSKFVLPVLVPYYAGQQIDADGIMLLVTALKNDADSDKFIIGGTLKPAIEHDGSVDIAPQVIIKAIIDKCM